jgi:hypothetical protein
VFSKLLLELLIAWSIVLLFAGLLFWIFETLVSMPIVYYSTGTEQCVKVDPETAGTCQELPERYLERWVQ